MSNGSKLLAAVPCKHSPCQPSGIATLEEKSGELCKPLVDLRRVSRKFCNNFFLFCLSLQQLWLRVKHNLKALNLIFDPNLEEREASSIWEDVLGLSRCRNCVKESLHPVQPVGLIHVGMWVTSQASQLCLDLVMHCCVSS